MGTPLPQSPSTPYQLDDETGAWRAWMEADRAWKQQMVETIERRLIDLEQSVSVKSFPITPAVATVSQLTSTATSGTFIPKYRAGAGPRISVFCSNATNATVTTGTTLYSDGTTWRRETDGSAI